MSDQEGEDKYFKSSQRDPEEAAVLAKGPSHCRKCQVVPRFRQLDDPHAIILRASLVPDGHVWWWWWGSVSLSPFTSGTPPSQCQPEPVSGAKALLSLWGLFILMESFSSVPSSRLPPFSGASVTGDSQATVARPIGWTNDQMPQCRRWILGALGEQRESGANSE